MVRVGDGAQALAERLKRIISDISIREPFMDEDALFLAAIARLEGERRDAARLRDARGW